ncbi:hypothetical protein H0H93_009150 [Arthromyces matolae]|nr:hypothetical protein H0H93_009150 [Arthromyces matolae]
MPYRELQQDKNMLLGGTSYAAPLISGILALMLDAYGPNFSPVELKAILLAEGFHGVIQNLDTDAPNNILAHIPPAISGRDEIARGNGHMLKP